MALVDGSGTVQTEYTYEPFGNTTTSGQTNGNTIEYTGRENDGTGLYYYRARYYSPTLGRFISPDLNLHGCSTAQAIVAVRSISKTAVSETAGRYRFGADRQWRW